MAADEPHADHRATHEVSNQPPKKYMEVRRGTRIDRPRG